MPDTSENLPSAWKKAEVTSKIIASVLVPLAIALFGYFINNALKKDELELRYIELAIGVLKEEPEKKAANLRKWAIDTINSYAKIKFTKDVIQELKNQSIHMSILRKTENEHIANMRLLSMLWSRDFLSDENYRKARKVQDERFRVRIQQILKARKLAQKKNEINK